MKRKLSWTFFLLLCACGSVTSLSVDGGGGTSGGIGGHEAGAGGTGVGGQDSGTGGKLGTGGAGGVSACQVITTLGRSCTVDSDCMAARHVANCCGTVRIIGLRAADRALFGQLEGQCDASYPLCGCATGATTTDDGSVVKLDAEAGVTCLQGTCTTFASACTHPCATGTTCFTCLTHNAQFAACTTACTGNTDCKDASLPMCQTGTSGNVSGKYCTATGVACDTK